MLAVVMIHVSSLLPSMTGVRSAVVLTNSFSPCRRPAGSAGRNRSMSAAYNGPLKLDTELRQIKTLNFVVEYGKDITQKVHA